MTRPVDHISGLTKPCIFISDADSQGLSNNNTSRTNILKKDVPFGFFLYRRRVSCVFIRKDEGKNSSFSFYLISFSDSFRSFIKRRFYSIMGRLTPEVIEAAPQYLNPVGQYELCLRGNDCAPSFQLSDFDKSIQYFLFSIEQIRRFLPSKTWVPL